MTANIDKPETIQVTLELSSSVGHLAGAGQANGRVDLRMSLQGYLEQLIAGLGLPAVVALTIDLSPEQPAPAGGPYEVLINGQRCRLVSALALPATETELARSVARSVVRNRELLVSAALAAKIQDQWQGATSESPAANLAPSEFHSLLITLVNRGFTTEPIGPSPTPGRDSAGSNRGAESIFEEIIAARIPRIRLFLAQSRAEALAPSDKPTPLANAEDPFRAALGKLPSTIFDELGLMLPEVELAGDDSLNESDLRLQLNDLVLPTATGVGLDQFAVNQTAEELSRVDLSGQRMIDSITEKECIVLPANDELTKKCRDANLPNATSAEYVLVTVRGEIERNAGSFLTTDVVQFALNSLRQTYPIIVDAAAQRLDVLTLTRILRGLVDEGLSIRDLRTILEGLVAVDGATTIVPGKYVFFFSHASLPCPVDQDKTLADLDVNDYLKCLRIWLNRQISSKYLTGAGSLPAYFMSPQIEERLRNLKTEPLTEEEHSRLRAAMVETFSQHPAPTPAVLITTVDVRRALKSLLEREFPDLPVVCYEELSKYANVEVLAQITLELDSGQSRSELPA
jgi:hypothetical protein